MYVQLTHREPLDMGWVDPEFDKERDSINLHINMHTYLNIPREEWLLMVELVAKILP